MDEKSYDNLSWQIGELANQIEQMDTIRIKNGGGRNIMFKRDEFNQMIYDKSIWKWKDFVKDLSIIALLLTNIGLMLKAFGII